MPSNLLARRSYKYWYFQNKLAGNPGGPPVPTASEITFDYDDYNYTTPLVFPTTRFGSGPAYYGPNFEFTATPEPGLYGVIALGLTGLVAAVRRRKSV